LIAEIVAVMTRPPVRCGKSRPSDDRCGVGLLRHRQHTDGEIDVALYLGQQRTDIVGAGNGQDAACRSPEDVR
jgi:hypothetical protein